MSEGTCHASISTSAMEATAHAPAQTVSRGHAHDTATATRTVRMVCPLGNELSKATRWTPSRYRDGRTRMSLVATSTTFPTT
jgi:hypothetical protein